LNEKYLNDLKKMGSIIKIYSNNQIKCLSFQTSKIQFLDTLVTKELRKISEMLTSNNLKFQGSKFLVSSNKSKVYLLFFC